MRNPLRRHVDRPHPGDPLLDIRGDEQPVESALRASLVGHAAQAPGGDLVAERVLASVERTAAPAGPRAPVPSRWGGRLLPLVAAAAVAAVVGTAVAIQNYHPDAASPPAVSHSASPPRPTASAPAPTRRPTATRAVTSSAADSSVVPPPVDTSTLHGVEVVDLTFTGADQGYGLASAKCIGGTGRCTALIHTTDGAVWRSLPGTPFNVPGASGGCTDPCVEHLRFATDRIGYAFGPSALFMTTDGAATWRRQTGLGADALETLDGNVILVDAIDTGAGNRRLQTAPIGSTRWTSRSAAGFPANTTRVFLGRAGHEAVLLLSAVNPAKGNGLDQAGVLLRSSDDGRTWTNGGEPCPPLGAGYSHDSVTAAIGSDGTVVVDCLGRSTSNQRLLAGSTIVSTDGGASFTAPAAGGRLGPADLLAAAGTQQFLVTGRMLYRSADAGNSWNQVVAIPTSDIAFLGFESARVGRVVADGGRSIWTTRDGGGSWTEVPFR